ncbi:MFS transporter [Microbaculum marinum]|uniref:MFS transporter n=1 Tax=Microbaculum marinum TaxID=1764581 RepID=A0AAW9RU40_9HYPH
MRSALASIAALLISVLILLAGSGLQATLVPLAAKGYGFQDVLIGFIGSSYFIGMMIGCFAAPWLIKRTGHIRTFGACTALATGTAVLHALIVEPVTWNLLRCISGICFAVLYAVIESWLNDKSDNANRGTVLATYNVINFGGMAFGQQFLRLYPPAGFQLFSVSALLISLAAIPVALTRSASPMVPESPRLRLLWLIRLSPVGVAGAFTVGLANGAFWTIGPIFATLQGLGPGGAGDFITASILGAVAALWPAGLASDRMDRRYVIVLCSAVAALAGIALALTPSGNPWLLYGFAFLFGAGAMPVYSLSSAHSADYAKPSDMVVVSTGLLLVYTIGAVVGPTAAATLVEFTAPGALFALTATAHAGMAAFAIYRLTRRSPIPPEEREPFVPVPRTSPAVSELDPRVPQPDEEFEILEETDTEAPKGDAAGA